MAVGNKPYIHSCNNSICIDNVDGSCIRGLLVCIGQSVYEILIIEAYKLYIQSI
jgi:hypothetical protein